MKTLNAILFFYIVSTNFNLIPLQNKTLPLCLEHCKSKGTIIYAHHVVFSSRGSVEALNITTEGERVNLSLSSPVRGQACHVRFFNILHPASGRPSPPPSTPHPPATACSHCVSPRTQQPPRLCDFSQNMLSQKSRGLSTRLSWLKQMAHVRVAHRCSPIENAWFEMPRLSRTRWPRRREDHWDTYERSLREPIDRA